jgi:hypothetical protein
MVPSSRCLSILIDPYYSVRASAMPSPSPTNPELRCDDAAAAQTAAPVTGLGSRRSRGASDE